MTTGAIKTIVICADSAIAAAPCAAGQAPVSVSAYVLDPSAGSYIDAIAEPFDYVNGALFWSAAFVFTLSLYLSTRVYGQIINMIRR